MIGDASGNNPEGSDGKQCKKNTEYCKKKISEFFLKKFMCLIEHNILFLPYATDT